MLRSSFCILMITFLFGCTHTQSTFVIAPSDSYVCFPDYDSCDDNPIPNRWKPFFESSFNEIQGISEVSYIEIKGLPSRADIRISDLDNGNICGKGFSSFKSFGELSRTSLPSKDKYEEGEVDACAIFYSPVLVSQWQEDLIRLKYEVSACQRVEKSIRTQKEIMDLASKISIPSSIIEQKSASALIESYRKQKILNKEEGDDFLREKNDVIGGTTRMREINDNHKKKVEMEGRLKDAVLKVELAQMALNRTLFYINETMFLPCDEGDKQPLVKPGSWVTKGSDVLRVDKDDSHFFFFW